MAAAAWGPAIDAAPALPPFDIELAAAGRTQVVRLHGELDLAYAAPVRSVLAAVDAPELVVDLSDLTFLDASGLSALLTARREILDRGGRVSLRDARRAVRRVFELTGLLGLLDR